MRIPASAAAVTILLTLASLAVADEVTLQIQDSVDDYKESSSGASTRGSSTHDLFTTSYQSQAYRFVSCPVPQGWTIEEARLELYAFGSNYAANPLDGYAVGEDVGNAPVWTGASFEITNAPKTAATASIAGLPAWTVDTHNPAGDVTAILQEIVDRPDYQAGNAVKILLVANSTASFRRTKTYDGGSDRGARLYIRFSDNQPPAADLDADPLEGPAPLAVAFDASGSFDPDGTIVSYDYDFGDGANGAGATTGHTYAADGMYDACVTVTDDQGGQDEACVSITVGVPVFTAALQIASKEDDYKETATGTSAKGDSTHDLFVSGDLQQAFRFAGSPIPAGAFIQRAELQLYATGSGADHPISGTARGEAAGDAPAWTGADFEITTASKTSASVAFADLPTWVANTHNPLVDVAPILQEIVDRPDYAAGQAFKLFLTGSTADFRRTQTYDANPARGARLEVDWTLVAPPLDAAISGPATADANATVVFDASASTGDIVAYVWDFGHGTAPVMTTGPTVAHRFGAFGRFVVSVTVVGEDEATDEASLVIETTGFTADNYLVKPVYFVPTNRTPTTDYEAKFRTAMRLIDQFYAENLEAMGFGYRPLNYEKDGNGDPVIHLVAGQFDDQYYLPTGSYETGAASAKVQTELEALFDMEKHCLLTIADVQWYDPSILQDVAPWSGGRAFPGRGGIGFVGNPFRWLGTTVAEQITIFDDPTMDFDIGPRPRGDNASILLGGMAHELAHAFGMQHTKTNGDLMTGAAWAFRNYFVAAPYGPAPFLALETAQVLDNSAMFRSDNPFGDNMDPTIDPLVMPLVEVGTPLSFAPVFTDAETGPALFQVYFNGHVADSFDVRGMGPSFAFPYTLGESNGLPEGYYPFGYIIYDGDSNRKEDASAFQVVSSIPPIPSPIAVDGAEWVWGEDERAADSYGQGSGVWQSTIKTSGNAGLYQKTSAGEQGFYAWHGAFGNPMSVSAGDRITAYVYIVAGSSLEGIAVEIGENVGGGIRLYWGEDTFDTNFWSSIPVRIGDLPPAGGWVKLSVLASDLGITTTRQYVNMSVRSVGTGTLFWDRLGKKPGP